MRRQEWIKDRRAASQPATYIAVIEHQSVLEDSLTDMLFPKSSAASAKPSQPPFRASVPTLVRTSFNSRRGFSDFLLDGRRTTTILFNPDA